MSDEVCGVDDVTGGWAWIGGVKQRCVLAKGHIGPHESDLGINWWSMPQPVGAKVHPAGDIPTEGRKLPSASKRRRAFSFDEDE